MAINALLGYAYPAAEHPLGCSVWWRFIFGVGVNCLFSFSGQYQSLVEENKQRYGSTLFFYMNGAFGADFPQKNF